MLDDPKHIPQMGWGGALATWVFASLIGASLVTLKRTISVRDLGSSGVWLVLLPTPPLQRF